jgi:cytochrome c oxidase subunit 2
MLNFPIAPPQASNWAFEHDVIFYALTGLTVIFTAIVLIGMVWFTVRYREGTSATRAKWSIGNMPLEITWSVIPLLLGIVMFVVSAELFIRMRTPPKEATEIYVIGKQWMWHAQHQNGVRENNTLHVPVGRPIKLTMISQDVIHAFYIPAFRAQYHVVPGRYTQMWFTPTAAGEYHLFCGMYCGTQHSEMGGRVVALPPDEFAEWLANGGERRSPLTLAQQGERLWKRLRCDNCHVGQDTMRAPTLMALYGKERRFSNAAPLRADEAYIRESILKPWSKLTEGYDRTMPAYDQQITEEDVLKLLAYIKSLGTPGQVTTETVATGSTPSTVGSVDGRNDLSVGALNYNAERTAPTPTDRNTPAVGALAAEDRRTQ